MRLVITLGFPGVASGKESDCQYRRHKRHRFDARVGKIPWSRKWQPAPVFLSGKSHGQRNLVGYSPWGCKEHILGKGLRRCLRRDGEIYQKVD